MSNHEHRSGVFELDTLIDKDYVDQYYNVVKKETEEDFCEKFCRKLEFILIDGRSYTIKIGELKLIPWSNEVVMAQQTMLVFLTNATEADVGDYLESNYFDYWLEQHDSDYLTDVSESGKVFRRTNYGWIRVL